MKSLAEFVSQHLTDDTSRLLLGKSRWPDVDIDLAVNCIEARRRMKGKVNEWYDNHLLVFPSRLSAEQCSSSSTALYKAELAERIAGKGFKVADLTGGLGVDAWYFSQRASKVLYNEMQEMLCKAARHNFESLGSENIICCNYTVAPKGNPDIEEPAIISPAGLLQEFCPDLIYLDPARRGAGGRKVFLIEDCTPDVLGLKDELFEICRHILIKLSPMADISMVCGRLGNSCREIHTVAAQGECKELLVWMDREWDKEYTIIASETHNDNSVSTISFKPSEERNADISLFDPVDMSSGDTYYLFEPGKAIMKAGAFNMTGSLFGLSKLGRSTHYYIFNDDCLIRNLMNYGKVFRILQCAPLDKRSIKTAGRDYPKAEVTARNIMMDTDTLRKRTGVVPDDTFHIFGLRSDLGGNLLICTSRII